MKFRRMACDCCKTSAERLQCKSPIYVLSDVVDNSNIIFLLMSKKGRTSCGGPLAIDPAPADGELPGAAESGRATGAGPCERSSDHLHRFGGATDCFASTWECNEDDHIGLQPVITFVC